MTGQEPLPYLTADLPGIGGALKREPEDFEVEEVAAYEPEGAGEHLFLWIEKRDVSAEHLTRHVARVLGISSGDVGVAGLKDRRAVTRQYVSVPAKCEADVPRLETESIRVLRSARHRNKLRTGHLKGNRFSILIRDASPEAADRAAAIVERLRAHGFPNYFGEQRFGVEGETLSLGLDLLAGRTTPRKLPPARRRFLLRLALSAVQSELFNAALADRIRDGLADRVLPGDVMQVVESGGVFIAEDAAAEQARFDAGEVVTTGPMFGPKMKAPAGEAAEREARVLGQRELTAAAFEKFSKLTSGTRRAYFVRPRRIEVSPESDRLRVTFELPSGAYATSLLRELMKSEA